MFPLVDIEGFDSAPFVMDLLETKGVGLAPASTFGDYSQFVCISLGASEEDLSKGARLIGEYLREKRLF